MSSSACVSSGSTRGLLRMEEEAKASERQGIGSILGSEHDRPKTAASLRRTLSADMSSKKWLGRHGFTPLKKIPSSESFPVLSSDSSSSEGEEDEGDGGGQFDNWKQQKDDLKRPGLSDVWGSILSQKVDDSSKSSLALYIPPPVKRSKSSLNQKSLEVCTESLGSETGSDGFSFDKSAEEKQSIKETEEVSSEAATVVEEKNMEIEEKNMEIDYSATKKSSARSIPPPIPSLSRREGPGFLMRSHRRDGRLVLAAVPVSSYNYFQAERQGGRLLLSFIEKPSTELMETDEEEEEIEEEEEFRNEVEADVFDEFQGFEEEEETERVEKTQEIDEVQERGIVKEVVKGSQPTAMVPCEVINVYRSAATLTSKLMGLTNKNPTWSHSHKNVDLLEEEEEEEEEEEMEEEPTQLPQSLPCPPRVAHLMPSTTAAAAAAAASFNAYDYFWRTKPSSAAKATMPPTQQPSPPPPMVDNNDCCYYPNKLHNNKNKINNNNKSVISKGGLKSQEQQKQMQVSRGNEADCLVPPVRGCKEARRSLPIWQPPRCIATS